VYLLVFDCKGFEKALMENTDKKSQEKAMRKEFTDSVQTWLDQVQARIPGATVMLAASKIDMLKKPETTVPKITETVLRFIKDSEQYRRDGLIEDKRQLLDAYFRSKINTRDGSTRYTDKEIKERVAKVLEGGPFQRGATGPVAQRIKVIDGLLNKRLKLPGHVWPISSLTGKGVPALRQALIDACNKSVFGFLGGLIPESDYKLSELVREERGHISQYVTWDEWRKICVERAGVPEAPTENLRRKYSVLLEPDDEHPNVQASSVGRAARAMLQHELKEAGLSPGGSVVECVERLLKYERDAHVRHSTQFLHQTGDVLWFQDRGVSNFVFLNPQWLVDVVKYLIRHDLSEILEDMEWQEHKEMLQESCGGPSEIDEDGFEAMKARFSDEGLLVRPLLRCLWKDLRGNESVKQTLERLLSIFGVATPVNSSLSTAFVRHFAHSVGRKGEYFNWVHSSEVLKFLLLSLLLLSLLLWLLLFRLGAFVRSFEVFVVVVVVGMVVWLLLFLS
jgi:hypothetical protein